MSVMSEAARYQIVIRGTATERVLGPLVDDFTVDHPRPHRTRLTGEITDSSHLHGVLHHLTSLAVEVVSITPIEPEPRATESQSNNQQGVTDD